SFYRTLNHRLLHSFPTRRSSDLVTVHPPALMTIRSARQSLGRFKPEVVSEARAHGRKLHRLVRFVIPSGTRNLTEHESFISENHIRGTDILSVCPDRNGTCHTQLTA